MSGSDDRMDCREMFWDPINPLPKKCAKCGFPDLDYVPQPYFLVKSRTMSPNEMAIAENGNFFVRPRIRRILELLAPGQCRFFPTSYKGTTAEAPWFLAVPTHQVVAATVNASIPRCGACGEPRSAHPGSQYEEWVWNYESECDVLKSSTWRSSESGWDQWISRYLFMSARLVELLKQIKARGLYEIISRDPAGPADRDVAWAKDQLPLLEAGGIPIHADVTLSGKETKWLRSYVKSHLRKQGLPLDVKAAERRLKLKLPKSYIEFVTKVGPVSFENVDEQEGFTVRILTPDRFDTQSYRVGVLDSGEQTNAVDGVMFAATEHGDCFCFDVQKHQKEFSVHLYKHEYNQFEPYAENFAACIKRFAES